MPVHSRPEGLLGGPVALVGATVYLLTGLVAAGLVWSYLTAVDVVVRAPGIVRPDGEILRITAEAAGTVEAVFVTEGATVITGDTLLRLDEKLIGQERDTLLDQIALTRVQLRELTGKLHVATRMREVEARNLDEEIAAARHDLSLRQDRHRADLKAGSIRLESAQAEHARNRRLFAEGLVARQLMERAETEFRLAQAEMDGVVHQQPSTGPLNSLLDRRDMMLLEWEIREKDIQAEAAPLEARVNELRLRLERAIQKQRHYTVRSPASGQLTMLASVHPGEAVEAGTVVAHMVPKPVRLVVEALIANVDGSEVAPGQQARLRFDESRTAGGVVLSVSPDARLTKSGEAVYRVLIAPDTAELRLGLAMEVRLIVRQERVITLLFNRIARAFRS